MVDEQRILSIDGFFFGSIMECNKNEKNQN